MVSETIRPSIGGIRNRRNHRRHAASALGTLVVFGLFYVFSVYLLGYYQYGDQVYYRQFYETLSGTAIADVPTQQLASLGGAEPVYGYLMWIGSNLGIDKDLYIAFYNAIFAALLYVLLKKSRVSFFGRMLIFSNFYFLVLLTSAERLKFSYIFMLLGAVTVGRIARLSLILAPLSHFQTFINYSSEIAGRLARFRMPRVVTMATILKFAFSIMIAALVAAFVFSNYSNVLLDKVSGYSDSSSGIDEILLLLGLTLIGVVIAKERWEFVLTMTPVLVAAYFLGSTRANMIGVIVFYFFFLRKGQANHWLMYPILFYFSFKSLDFLQQIIVYGNGFQRITN